MEYGYDIGNMKAFADKEMKIEIEMETIPEGVLHEILGGIPIIKCKDCKHWYPDADCGMACEFTNMSQPEDGYCNWAERK